MAGLLPRTCESCRVVLEGQPAPDDPDTLVEIVLPADGDTQSEPVEQLGAQLALLGIHGTDQGESRRMGDTDSLPLDGVDAHRGGVQQQVDDVIIEQVHLVDVEDRPVRRSQQTGLEATSSLPQGSLHVEGPGDAVLGGPHR